VRSGDDVIPEGAVDPKAAKSLRRVVAVGGSTKSKSNSKKNKKSNKNKTKKRKNSTSKKIKFTKVKTL